MSFNIVYNEKPVDEQVKKFTENDLFEDLLTKAMNDRKKIIREPEDRVKDIFRDKDLIEQQIPRDNKTLLLCNLLLYL